MGWTFNPTSHCKAGSAVHLATEPASSHAKDSRNLRGTSGRRALRVSDIIGDISTAASEQSDGISQVNTAVSQLDTMRQQNAALVEESAAAAESLKDQAARLAQIVSVFRMN